MGNPPPVDDHISSRSGEPGKSVLEILKAKHPSGQPVSPDAFLQHDETLHPMVFDSLDRALICS